MERPMHVLISNEDIHTSSQATDFSQTSQTYNREDIHVDHRIIFTKRECPLEMSMKAANIEHDFGNDLIETMEGGGSFERGQAHLLRVPVIESSSGVPCIISPEDFSQGAMLQNTHLVTNVTEQMEGPSEKVIFVQRSEIVGGNGEKGTTKRENEDENRESMLCEVDESDSDSDDEPLVRGFYEESTKDFKEQRRTVRNRRNSSRRYSKSWSSSDDESLANIAIKPEKNYRNDIEDCCERECNRNFNLKSQLATREMFKELEGMAQGDRFLVSCLEATSETIPANALSVEIANESNGNQVISNEIEEAIRESLREQQAKKEESEQEGNENGAENSQMTWEHFIVIGGNRRQVCLQFLLSTLSIDANRIDALKRTILSHEPVDRLPIEKLLNNSKEVWEVVSRHISSLGTEIVPHCSVNPPHLCLMDDIDCPTLYEMFQSYHSIAFGVVPFISYAAYRRYVQAHITFTRGEDNTPVCSDVLESQTCNCEREQRKSKTCTKCDCGRSKRKRKSIDKYLVPSEEVKIHKKKKSKQKNPQKGSQKGKGKKAKGGQGKDKKGKKKQLRSKRNAEESHGNKKQGPVANGKKRGDVFSLMHAHLKKLSSIVLKKCKASPYHRFLDAKTVSVQGLYEEYRKYFLNATNSELGLRFAIYESLLLRNQTFAITDLDGLVNCPRCCGAPVESVDLTLGKECEKK